MKIIRIKILIYSENGDILEGQRAVSCSIVHIQQFLFVSLVIVSVFPVPSSGLLMWLFSFIHQVEAHVVYRSSLEFKIICQQGAKATCIFLTPRYIGSGLLIG